MTAFRRHTTWVHNYLIFLSFYCSEWLSLHCQNQIALRRPTGVNKGAKIKELPSFNLSEIGCEVRGKSH